MDGICTTFYLDWWALPVRVTSCPGDACFTLFSPQWACELVGPCGVPKGDIYKARSKRLVTESARLWLRPLTSAPSPQHPAAAQPRPQGRAKPGQLESWKQKAMCLLTERGLTLL